VVRERITQHSSPTDMSGSVAASSNACGADTSM
jgi:hypothetical protein